MHNNKKLISLKSNESQPSTKDEYHIRWNLPNLHTYPKENSWKNWNDLNICKQKFDHNLNCTQENIIFNKKLCEGEMLINSDPYWCDVVQVKKQNFIMHIINSTFYGGLFTPLEFELITTSESKRMLRWVQVGSSKSRLAMW